MHRQHKSQFRTPRPLSPSIAHPQFMLLAPSHNFFSCHLQSIKVVKGFSIDPHSIVDQSVIRVEEVFFAAPRVGVLLQILLHRLRVRVDDAEACDVDAVEDVPINVDDYDMCKYITYYVIIFLYAGHTRPS